MKLIGVTGKSGAGKTTFSNILAENENIGVIHVDDILTNMKLKYFKIFMNKNKEGEKTKINSKLKMFLYKHKLIFDLFMKFRAKIIEKQIEEQIQRMQNEGKEYTVIDDIFIKYQKRFKDLSKIIIIERPYIIRKKALKKRDDLTKEEIVANDIAHYKGNYKEIIETRNVQKISNDGTEEELREKANQVYKKYFISFKDKYKECKILNNKKTQIITKNTIKDKREER